MRLRPYKLAFIFLVFFCIFISEIVSQSLPVPNGKDADMGTEQKQQVERESKKTKKNKIRTRENFIMEKIPGTVYVFGVSQYLGENKVYITEINAIDSIALQKNTRFLPFRSSFSLQLQQYTEGKLGQTHQTVSVFFDANKDKLKKTLNAVKKRYLSNTDKIVTILNQDQFHFVHPLDLIEQSPVYETE